MQQERKIKLHSLQEVKDFVLAATTCDFDVDVCYNRVVVDGKSILGIYTMDLSAPVTLIIYDEEDFVEKEIGEFVV